ncbi:MAG: hypothetical protein K5765_06475, partial [Clostridia bacterium]|nr:hypothetical protein [Clostridia bacterium]
MKKKFLFLFIFILLISFSFIFIACSYTGTDNEKDNVVININSVSDFLKIATQQNSSLFTNSEEDVKITSLDTVPNNSTTATNITYSLKTDINLSSNAITIDDENISTTKPNIIPELYGIIEGNNHRILFFSVETETTTFSNVGLIGQMMGKIRNIKMANSNLNLYSSTNVGLFAAVNRGSISNVVVESSCSINITASGTKVGGIAGDSTYKQTSGLKLTISASQSIDNCVNNANINVENGTTIGGIIGNCQMSDSNQKTAKSFSNNVNNGNITCNNYGTTVGGLIGSLSGYNLDVSNNVNNGNITADAFVGGIIGKCSAKSNGVISGNAIGKLYVNNNVAKGKFIYNVAEYKSGITSAGGIIGNLDISSNTKEINIQNCVVGDTSKQNESIF